MFSLLVFLVLFVGCLANPVLVFDSFSLSVGPGTGDSFTTDGNGRITGVRVWEITNAYITGIQFCHNGIWDEVVGRVYGVAHEIMLFEHEVFTQVSGDYHTHSYIYQLIFGTSRGRILVVGHPRQRSFNMFATHPDAELRLLIGRENGHGITSVAAYWGIVYEDPVGSGSSIDC